MKKRLAFLTCLLLCFCLLLSGCSNLTMPATDAKIVGNGDTVVQKGEYIYFANAYTGYSSVGSDVSNKKGEADVYSLYRVKSVDGKLEYDENGMVKNAELVVSKVVGFEYSNLYIVGDYLYFSSPNMHKTSSNEHKYDLISIFKVKLDGSGLKELYTTEQFSGDWAVLEFGSDCFVITVENDQIVRHKIAKNGDLENKTILADGVSNAILPQNKNYANDKNIYFTCDRSEQDTNLGLTGNYLKSVNICTGKIENICGVSDETYDLLAYDFGTLIYSKKNNINTTIFAKDLDGETKLADWSNTSISNVKIAQVMGQGLKFVYTCNSKVVVQDFGSLIPSVLIDGNATIINIDEDCVYFTLDNKISKISLIDKQIVDIYEDSNMGSSFDFDGRYIYLFTQAKVNSTSTKYMHYIDTFAIEQQTNVEAKPLGVFKSSDKMIEE